MPTLNFAIFSQSTSIDQHSKSLSIFNVIEELTLPVPKEGVENGTPIPLNSTLTTSWQRDDKSDDNNVDIILSVQRPDGTEGKDTANIPLDLGDSDRYRAILNIGTLLFHGEGEYQFVIRSDKGEEYGRVPFYISLKPQS